MWVRGLGRERKTPQTSVLLICNKKKRIISAFVLPCNILFGHFQ